ncbi:MULTISPECIES: hypothetical protein [unclassified Caballeronia]|uniref:hypothetical protein n=1 Tax=unclassified Caballeronia TaxID=2646786 RepID=UPI0028579A75|nr:MULTISPECIES: hypothetical protein [unclassified Caballeronia]MDR5739731.1 hypothetical protein [Caballeronia sp. LZ016]MDR5808196.1 hypothetical protein [Caballeronia sp. LZ019]
MAARKPKAKEEAQAAPRLTLFALAERQIVGLYDAGVLSPAVLHQVIAAYADSGIDWNEAGSMHTVDDRTLQEAVVLIMMPGRALRSAQKDFLSVVEHLSGRSPPKAHVADDTSEEPADDEDLLSQLGGKRSDEGSEKQEASSRKPAGFNPLVGARAIPKHKR